jgi:hypothetical protein
MAFGRDRCFQLDGFHDYCNVHTPCAAGDFERTQRQRLVCGQVRRSLQHRLPNDRVLRSHSCSPGRSLPVAQGYACARSASETSPARLTAGEERDGWPRSSHAWPMTPGYRPAPVFSASAFAVSGRSLPASAVAHSLPLLLKARKAAVPGVLLPRIAWERVAAGELQESPAPARRRQSAQRHRPSVCRQAGAGWSSAGSNEREPMRGSVPLRGCGAPFPGELRHPSTLPAPSQLPDRNLSSPGLSFPAPFA